MVHDCGDWADFVVPENLFSSPLYNVSVYDVPVYDEQCSRIRCSHPSPVNQDMKDHDNNIKLTDCLVKKRLLLF